MNFATHGKPAKIILRILGQFDQPYDMGRMIWSISQPTDASLIGAFQWCWLDHCRHGWWNNDLKLIFKSSWCHQFEIRFQNFCRHFTHHIWYVNWYVVTHCDALAVCHMGPFQLEFCTSCKLETECYIHDQVVIWQATFLNSYSNEIFDFNSVNLD